MDSIRVQGGIPLRGKVRIQGSKNAVLPILAACILVQGQVVLENCPKISDVYGMLAILKSLGCRTMWEGHRLYICTESFKGGELPQEAVSCMRSSVFLLGALLGRNGSVQLDHPGGCVIGKRPIDIHLTALKQMGVDFRETKTGFAACAGRELQGAEIRLPFPSVGATENLIMAAVMAHGNTKITGAAREPEVQALCEFLNACGADIRGIGERVIEVKGGQKLTGTKYVIPADRIVAGTYLLAGFAAGGEVFLEKAPVKHMRAVLETAERMGAVMTQTGNGLYVQFPERSGELPCLNTEVYPGFPTDLQSVFLAVRCTGEGKTVIRETIFENRFRIIPELLELGADIRQTDAESVCVTGVEKLFGADVEAFELRGGAALVAAALGAEGETIIRGRKFIDRGYENISRDLRGLGARIVSE